MARIVWATDVHLNFVDERRVDAFADALAALAPDHVLLGGDIGEAGDVFAYVDRLAERLRRPLHYVLGNHDFYGGSIAAMRAEARARGGNARWLPAAGVVPLSTHTALVGHDGWGDARLGTFDRSQVFLNDFLRIDELRGLDRQALRARLQDLGDDAATSLRRDLARAVEAFEHVVVLTHVPPFAEACWHQGAISAPDWLPFFTCAATGEVIRAAAAARPERRLTVLCGHTHGSGNARILPNLEVHTGGAEYGAPAPQLPLVVA
jgi:3',5'-cyclic-AMP phosphodiesterase